MFNYEEIIISKGKREIKLGGLILNDDANLEFTVVTTEKGAYGTSAIYNEKSKRVCYDKVWLPVAQDDIKRLAEWKYAIVTSINALYKKILTGQEEVLAIPTEGESISYILTTRTIMESAIYSPKFVKSLIFAFSKDGLRKINVDLDLQLEGYDDLQVKIGTVLDCMDMEPYKRENGAYYSLKLMDVISQITQRKAS